MQSTGHSSVHDWSMTSRQSPAMTYGMSIPLSGGLRDGGLLVCRVTRKDLRSGVQVDRCVGVGCGHLAEPYCEERVRAVVVGDVTGGVGAGHVGAHRRVDDELPVVVQLHSPLAKGAQVRREPEGRHELR